MFGLFPRNDVYFDLFLRSSSNMNRAAQLMHDLCMSNGDRSELIGAIREVEHKGDDLIRQIMKLMVKSYVTPFDREDIHALSSSIVDVVDNIDDASKSFSQLHLTKPIPEYLEQVVLLQKACEIIHEAIGLMPNKKNLTKSHVLIRKIYDIESEGDAVHGRAISRLFSELDDAKEILKWHKLCDYLEEALDACQGVGNTLEMMLLKTY